MVHHVIAMRGSTFRLASPLKSSGQIHSNLPATVTPSSKCPNPKMEGRDILVIHPGSDSLRLGLASDGLPKVLPHVIARRITCMDEKFELGVPFADKFTEDEDSMKEVEAYLSARMKEQKLRVVQNAAQQVQIYNSQSEPEEIPEMNDVLNLEITNVQSKPSFVIGSEALLIDTNMEPYKIHHPFRFGELNRGAYRSEQALQADLIVLWTEAIEKNLLILREQFKSYYVALILGDACNQSDISLYMDILLRHMGFEAVTFFHDSVCSAWGAGLSNACVIDMGPEETRIVCVKEGRVVPTTRYKFKFGGNQYDEIFYSLLMKNSALSSEDCDIRNLTCRDMVSNLKKKCFTLKEADISVTVHECYLHTPGALTKRFRFKLYDEVYIAPLLPLLRSRESHKFEGDSEYFSLKAVAKSILDCCIGHPVEKDNEKPLLLAEYELHIQKYLNSIVLVGGGLAKIPGIESVLTEMIAKSLPGLVSSIFGEFSSTSLIDEIEIVSKPKDIDPCIVSWKGGAVAARLECLNDAWVCSEEYNSFGIDLLVEKTIYDVTL